MPSPFSRLSPESRQKARDRCLEPEIKTSFAHLQTQSPLFALPAGVRILIFEHLLGTGTIHITWREADPPTDPITTGRSIDYEQLPQAGDHEPEMKLTYALCRQRLDDFSWAYALSKTPANWPDEYVSTSGYLLDIQPEPEDVFRSYDQRHRDCHVPIRALVLQDYIDPCRHSIGQHGCWTRNTKCESCNAERAQLVAEYGLPPDGVERMYPESKLHLAMLRTCKKAYHEARLLPFALRMFDVPNPAVLQDFAEKFLKPYQVAAIETIHINGPCWAALHFLRLMRFFPNLKHVKASNPTEYLRYYELSGHDGEWKKYFRTRSLKSVQIIFGYDGRHNDIEWSDDRDDQRPECRENAEKFEKFLMAPSYEEAGDADGRRSVESWWQDDYDSDYCSDLSVDEESDE